MITRKLLGVVFTALLLHTCLSFATGITETDSTQPRGSAPGVNPDDIVEIHAIAEGYGDLLGEDNDGVVSEQEKEFHFALLNKIVKDNRIPPKGFDKAAYMAEGVFIIPEDAYADDQNWGEALQEIYEVSGNGPAVQFARKKTIRLRR